MVKISYSPYSLRGMKRKLGPCERGCGVRPLMVTDDVYGLLRKRTKRSNSRGKGIARFLFRRKTTPFSRFLVEQRRLLSFSVSGDGPISLFPLQASICVCAWPFLFSNCCCCAEQGCPKMLECTIYPFLRIMTQKPRSELTNQDLRISSMTDFKVFEYNTSLVFFSCIYSKRPLKCLKQLKCGWFCAESLYSYHLWPFLIQPQSLPLNFSSITAEWHGLFFAVRP